MDYGLSVILPALEEPGLLEFVDHLKWVLNKSLPVSYEILVQEELGLTAAVCQGVKRSRYPIICVMDADGSHDPHDVPPMWWLAMNPWNDLVVGYKTYDETAWYRRLISKVYRWLGRNLINNECKDPMSGFTCGDRKLYEQLKPSMDYKYLLQLLVLKPKIQNFPIAFMKRKQGKSKANIMTGIRTFINIIKYSVST